jgi:hypothetical protein
VAPAGDVAGGKSVGNAGELRSALSEAKSAGKHSVLLRIKNADSNRYLSMPIGRRNLDISKRKPRLKRGFPRLTQVFLDQ